VIGLPDEKHSKLRTFVDGLKLYVYKQYNNPQDIICIIDTDEDALEKFKETRPQLEEFLDPDDPDDEVELELAKKECVEARKEWRKRREELITNQQKLYMLLWGQCSHLLRTEIKLDEAYKTNEEKKNALWLFRKITSCSSRVSVNEDIYVSVNMAIKNLYTIEQGPTETLHNYHQRFTEAFNSMKISEIDDFTNVKALHLHECSVDLAYGDNRDADVIQEDMQRKLLTRLFIINADQERYKGAIAELKDGQLMQNGSTYPDNLARAMEILSKHTTTVSTTNRRRQHQPGNRRANSGVTFNQVGSNEQQQGAPVAGTNGRIFDHITCHGCGMVGHYVSDCPNASGSGTGTQLHQHGVILADVSKATGVAEDFIRDNWLLLDTASTHSTAWNYQLCFGIEDLPTKDMMSTRMNNDTVLQFRQRGFFKLFSKLDAFVNEHSIANIIAHCKMAQSYRVTSDSAVSSSFFVYLTDDHVIEFKQCSHGLYYFDMSDHVNTTNSVVTP